MMYYLGSRWRRQTLVYFGEPQDLLFSIKKDARSAKIQLQSNPHLRTHKLSPGVRRSCPPRGCYPGTTGRSYGHLGVS